MASKYRKKFELPEGFYEVLENYSREVLRDQPLDIIEFSYLYFKALEEVSFKNISNHFVNLKYSNRATWLGNFDLTVSKIIFDAFLLIN